MKWLVKVLIVVVVAVLLSLLAIEDTGYVLISRTPWVVELSLTFFALIIAAGFVVFYMTLRFISNSWGISGRLREWRLHRRHMLARKSLNQGLLELAQRNWKKSEKLLIKNIEDSESPLINYLAAASAAQEQGADKRRDDLLSLAHESTPGSDVAVSLTQADLQLRHGQLEQALATLMHCRTIAPKHPHVLKLLIRIYSELQDWNRLHELLPLVRKNKLFNIEEQMNLESSVYVALLENATQLEEAQEYWSNMPKPVRSNALVLQQYVQKNLEYGENDQAIELLYKYLAKNWDRDLVKLYGQVQGSDKVKQLTWAEQWQQQHSDDHVLLDVLARLAVRNELWGKARAWFEASLGILPTAASYRALGDLLETLNEPKQAADCYRKGLQLLSE